MHFSIYNFIFYERRSSTDLQKSANKTFCAFSRISFATFLGAKRLIYSTTQFG